MRVKLNGTIKYGVVVVCMAMFITLVQPCLGQQTAIEDEELQVYFTEFNNTLFGLLQILKKQNGPDDNTVEEPSESFQIIRTDCELFEQLDPEIPLTGQYITSEMVFELIQDQNIYVQLKNDQTMFWVKRSCVRRYITTSPTKTFSNLEIGTNQWSDLAQTLYEKHLIEKKRFEKYVKRLRGQNLSQDINQEIKWVENKAQLIDRIWARITPTSNNEELTFAQKVRASGHILFGRSAYVSDQTDSSVGGYDGEKVDIDVQAQYDINSDAQVGLSIRNRSEVVLTPYQNFSTGAFYKQNFSDHTLQVRASAETYKDDVLTSNDYNKTSFQANIGNSTTGIFNYTARYQYLNQKFTNQSTNSYGRHHVDFQSVIRAGQVVSFRPSLVYSRGNSDNAGFQYQVIRPSISFFFDRDDKSDEIKLHYERSDFENLQRQNNNRVHFAWVKRTRNAEGKSMHSDIGLIARNFSNVDTLNYNDLYGKLNQRVNLTSKNVMVRWRHFPNRVSSDRWDIRHGIDKNGSFYLGYDVNIRIQAPTDLSFINQWDGYLKMGFSIKGFRFGPFWRGHIRMDLKNNDDGVFNQDQNSYQYGIEAQGFHHIANRVKLRYHAAYDLNTVYSRSADLTNPGVISIQKRNPSNVQFDIDIAVKLVSYLEIFGVAKYFAHNTDIDFTPGLTQVERNTGNQFTIGVRLHYN